MNLDGKGDERLKLALVPPFHPVEVQVEIGIVLVSEGNHKVFYLTRELGPLRQDFGKFLVRKGIRQLGWCS